MLRSGDDNFFCIAIANLKHPCTTPLTKHGPGLTVKPTVGHSLLDTRFANNVDLLAGFKPLDKGGDREDSPSSHVFL
jgi:hypothetical protein